MKRLGSLRYFIPLFLFYLLVISILGPGELEGDGIRYYASAQHYLNGQLTDPEHPNIRNGPVYPLLITPIVGLKLPLFTVYLLNVFLVVGGAMYLFSLLNNWLGERWAIFAAYVVSLYPPLILEVPRVAYEALTVFLICGYLYHLHKVLGNDAERRDRWLATIYMAMLALTKLIFPYIILILLGLSVFFLILRRKRPYRGLSQIHGFAYLFLLPYLFLTYQWTGKPFFWANVGGEIMYWKTTPHEDEFGEWYQAAVITKQKEIKSLDSCGMEQLFANHSPYFQELSDLNPMQKNEALSKRAKEQLREHPEAYIKNSVASFSRLFFNFPFSYTPQKLSTLGFIFSNMFFMVLGILGLIVAIIRFKFVPDYIWLVLLMGMAYMAGITLLNGRVRHLIPMIPVLVVFIAYVYSQLLEIRLKPQTELS